MAMVLGIPVVHREWWEDCKRMQRYVPIRPYMHRLDEREVIMENGEEGPLTGHKVCVFGPRNQVENEWGEAFVRAGGGEVTTNFSEADIVLCCTEAACALASGKPDAEGKDVQTFVVRTVIVVLMCRVVFYQR